MVSRYLHRPLTISLAAACVGLLALLWIVMRPSPLPEIEVGITETLNCASFPSKIWVHRVNTVERAQLLLNEFDGIEIDVVYDPRKQRFDVRHRDIPSIGLYLVDYFERLDERRKPLYWVDIKNLNADNQLDQLDRFLALEEKYSLQNRFIVESPSIELLQEFTDAGFITSYYLPHIDTRSASPEEIADWVKKLKAQISDSRVCAISADYEMYPLLRRYFSDADTLLWTSHRYDRQIDRHEIERIVSANRVKVLLVQQPTDHYR